MQDDTKARKIANDLHRVTVQYQAEIKDLKQTIAELQANPEVKSAPVESTRDPFYQLYKFDAIPPKLIKEYLKSLLLISKLPSKAGTKE